jgi:hypothetical protein
MSTQYSSSSTSQHNPQSASICNCASQFIAKCAASSSSGILAKLKQMETVNKGHKFVRNDDENANLYSIVILSLFAAVIMMVYNGGTKTPELFPSPSLCNSS